jgi:tetratricopeptide (TPR) repeat protein
MAREKRKDKKRDLDFEISFYEGVLKKRPDFFQALTALGNAYTVRGDYAEGLKIDLRLSRLRRDDPMVHYNLACSYSLLGKIDSAFKTLKNAIGLGYDDFNYLRRDPDLENLRKDKRFETLFKALKR